MEQQQGRPTPPMPPENYGKRMWQLWGPILIKWGIEFLVSMIAMTVLAMVYQVANPDAFTAALNSEQSMIDLYNQLLEQYLKSSTLIQGMTAFVIIPVMWIFFHRDRVKERMMGIVPNRKAPLWSYVWGSWCQSVRNWFSGDYYSSVCESGEHFCRQHFIPQWYLG